MRSCVPNRYLSPHNYEVFCCVFVVPSPFCEIETLVRRNLQSAVLVKVLIQIKFKLLSRTKWNRHAGNIFREMLIQNSQSGLTTSVATLQQLDMYKVEKNKPVIYWMELKDLLLQIFGIPLRVPYTDVDSLSDLLYSTGLHRHHGNEFALAVYIRPMSSLVLSVCLYFAYLESQ